QIIVAATFLLAAVGSSLADESHPVRPGLEESVASTVIPGPAADERSRAYRLMDSRLDYPTTWRVTQATPEPGTPEAVDAVEDHPHQVSASEPNRHPSTPVTSLWPLPFQSNNYRLENGEWNYNLQFQPVLPVSLTKDLNLITRPVIPLYNSVPHETAPGDFDRTTGFGDIILLELLSPAHNGNWILGAGPTFNLP